MLYIGEFNEQQLKDKEDKKAVLHARKLYPHLKYVKSKYVKSKMVKDRGKIVGIKLWITDDYYLTKNYKNESNTIY